MEGGNNFDSLDWKLPYFSALYFWILASGFWILIL